MRSVIGVAVAVVGLSSVTVGQAGLDSTSARSAARPTVVCEKLSLTVELSFGLWGGPGTDLVRRDQFAAVGSWGSNQLGGYAFFASATPRTAYTDRACARSSGSSPRTTGLSPRYRYRRAGANAYFESADGDRLLGELLHQRSISLLHRREPSAVAFWCRPAGGITVRITDVQSGGRSIGTTLLVSDRRRVLAVAELRRSGASSFRVATDCNQW